MSSILSIFILKGVEQKMREVHTSAAPATLVPRLSPYTSAHIKNRFHASMDRFFICTDVHFL